MVITQQIVLARSVRFAVASLIVLGLASRVGPLFDYGDRLLWQWPTEDGYLMMTIARNIALGRGMSISEGTIPTNGTQPLTTIVFTGLFWLVDGQRRSGVLLVQLWHVLTSVAAAWLLHALGNRVLRARPWGRSAAALGASAWFGSPVVIDRTMNGLETGTYVVVLLAAALLWLEWSADVNRKFEPLAAAGIGAVLGLAFLARIDAVFFIAAMTAVHVLATRHPTAILRRLAESAVMGTVSIVVAAPWLAYNQIRFGSVMPISGTAQSAAATLGGNLAHVPGALFEYAALVLPVPVAVETTAPVLAVTVTACLAYAAALVLAARRGVRVERLAIALAGTTALALVGYYGLLFGAAHFVSRYLFPVSPFFALVSASLFMRGIRHTAERPVTRRLAGAALAAIVLLAIALNARIYLAVGRGSAVDHRAVVRWVEANVPRDAWVAAVQTGTLGFFHERTINLDGKVNPHALEARLERRVPHYVVALPVAYIADWAGLASWIHLEPIDRHFELAVHDPGANLAVLRRVTPLPAVTDVGSVRARPVGAP
jgi:hypothetical protein